MGGRGYPPEFRRKVLDLLEEGRPVAQVAHDLDISQESIYTWRRQDRIDRGLTPGPSSGEKAELSAARKQIADLEAELKAAASDRAAEGVSGPRRRYSAAEVIVAGGTPVQIACRVVGISESG